MHKDLNNKQRKWLEYLVDYDIDIVYHLSKVNVVADALNKRSIVCGARLVAIGIPYEDQREDVVDWHLVAVLARLTISPTMTNCIRQAQAVDQLPEKWYVQGDSFQFG